MERHGHSPPLTAQQGGEFRPRLRAVGCAADRGAGRLFREPGNLRPADRAAVARQSAPSPAAAGRVAFAVGRDDPQRTRRHPPRATARMLLDRPATFSAAARNAGWRGRGCGGTNGPAQGRLVPEILRPLAASGQTGGALPVPRNGAGRNVLRSVAAGPVARPPTPPQRRGAAGLAAAARSVPAAGAVPI